MSKTIVIDPITRIEGHLKVEAVIDNGKVVDAKCSGTLFRGIEMIMKGRDPRDAQMITQRICGVCPIAHATACTLNLDSALGVEPPHNGRMIRNLILGANYMQSHILHFYHLAALDFVKGPDVAPFVPRYEGDYRLPKAVNDAAVAHYVQALEMRKKAHEMCAIFAGKMPHAASIIPGGSTCTPTQEGIDKYAEYLAEVAKFVNEVYVPDVIAVAGVYSDYFAIGAGCKQYLAYGVFDLDSNKDYTQRKRLFPMGRYVNGKFLPLDPSKITEDVKYSRFKSGSHLYPGNGETVPDAEKKEGYSWLKAPRYDGGVYEVGPLSRVLIGYTKGDDPKLNQLVESTLSSLKLKPADLCSVAGRHAARALEAILILDNMKVWLNSLKPGESAFNYAPIPDKSSGMGLTDAPRGAVGHWIQIKNHVTDNYQAVVPTTWNCSPKDDKGQHSTCEQALIGTKVKDADNPFELVRIVRSYDPCLACAIHVVTPKGRQLGKFRVI